MPDNLPIPTARRALLAGLGGLAAGTFLAAGRAEAGPLTPPGAPAPTPGPEPRTAINAQNTPGDATALFIITQPGSYYLTENVTGEAGKHGIKIAADNVTIDLVGFALLGVADSLNGIVTEGSRKNLAIRNGTISDWGGDGIRLTTEWSTHSALVEGVIVSRNGAMGIRAADNAVALGCVAYGNGDIGIYLPPNGVVANCLAYSNGGSGIQTVAGGMVTNCLARENGGRGIQTGFCGTVTGCAAYFNNLHGIQTGAGSIVTGCSTRNNAGNGIQAADTCTVTGCTARSNIRNGIEASNGSLVRDNACRLNDAAGIHCSAGDVRIEGNNCTANARGIHVTGAGNFIARNTCSGNTVANWDVAAGSRCLVINSIAASAFTGDSGGISPGSTNPNANYTY